MLSKHLLPSLSSINLGNKNIGSKIQILAERLNVGHFSNINASNMLQIIKRNVTLFSTDDGRL